MNWLDFISPSEYDWIRQSQIDWFLQTSGRSYKTVAYPESNPNPVSINAIERPFKPDTGKDFGDLWARQGDQILPATRKLAKPNALMFFHIPLYVKSHLQFFPPY